VDLDLREARFETATVEITAVAIFGGVEIKVPDDVVVQVEGAGIFGGFARPGEARQTYAGAPVLRVNGVAIFGGVDVKYAGPKDRKRVQG
jgi:hypothetical protein